MFSRNDIDNLAADLNFIRDNMEKVVRLCTILEYMNTDPMLSKQLVLKGGTAINLLVMPLPRLSVDIDLDFTENCDRPAMLRYRKAITEKLQAYMYANGYRLAPSSKHPFSVDSWVCQYTNVIGNLDNIKVEINYSMRCHLLPTEIKPVKLRGFENVNVRTLALVELYASKVKALLERGAARDLFDVYNMIRCKVISEEQKPMLRKGVVFYSAVGGNAKPTATYSLQPIERLQFKQIRTTLLPVLKKGTFYDLESVKQEVCGYLEDLMQLSDNERLFIDRFANNEYQSELLFEDKEIVERVAMHPMASWKIQNSH
ncbi:MAG: nucleotidyl transferase AbiEii/AbiGii toxin family protein [Bacteroidales bacterium]|nr:nucleotidyl transferase AbiEii/AbiGii toxin family protein [Bacteroidales bacterium]